MMPTPNIKTFVLLGGALVLASCAVPKAIVVEEPAARKMPESTPGLRVSEPQVAESKLPAFSNDGIRMPDMLGMPGDGDFNVTSPARVKTGLEAGAVISRPPTDPPSRVKPKATE